MVLYKHATKPVPLFSDLNDRELSLLAATGRRQKFPSKKMVLQKGEPGDVLDVLLVILSGTVIPSIPHLAPLRCDRREKKILASFYP